MPFLSKQVAQTIVDKLEDAASPVAKALEKFEGTVADLVPLFVRNGQARRQFSHLLGEIGSARLMIRNSVKLANKVVEASEVIDKDVVRGRKRRVGRGRSAKAIDSSEKRWPTWSVGKRKAKNGDNKNNARWSIGHGKEKKQ